ncbi:P-type conjugative transfer protein TrbG [Caulobacter soli]|uniref:P-type conjugative transfer protein TrbG n=1 Tax=Caulobacter soli TaxID=2708539 RepID=UPI001FEC5BF8|nr:P-type conjugative transfer protein TrbG [Caulobacter soli]
MLTAALALSIQVSAPGPARAAAGPVWSAAASSASTARSAAAAPPAAARSSSAPASASAPAAGASRPVRRTVRHRPARPDPGSSAPGSLTTIARANAQARDWPSPGAYVNSALYYDFEPGRLYTVHTSPRFLTTITLKPGEKLISKAAGDTVRWVLGETEAGSGDAVQVVIFVKPVRPGLRTNIVLTTDQRTYLIDAVSTASSAYTSVLSWTYPQDLAREAAAQRQRALAAEQVAAAAGAASDVAVERLNFRYRIDPVDKRPPAWTPVRVFDDGAKTYVEFPADLATRPAPPLFLLGDKDRAELVNYRQSGVYYVVDRLIDRAELRLGERRQDVVRIRRVEARP